MKTIKIYNIIATIIIALLVVWAVDLRKEIQETEQLLDQCSDKYYKEIK